MTHATSWGLAQEQHALSPLAKLHIADLQKRGVTDEFLAGYAAKLKAMQDAVAAHGSTTSDKEQLTDREQAAKAELILDIHIMQKGAKRTFPKGSPQLKEFHVNEKHNGSTGVLCKWAGEIARAWDKYKAKLIAEGNLVQEDVDTMVANAAVLENTDSTQETAKRIDSPRATAAADSATEAVMKAADYIYGAAQAAYAKDPATLGDFEKLKPLRYALPPRPKVPDNPTPPPPETPKS